MGTASIMTFQFPDSKNYVWIYIWIPSLNWLYFSVSSYSEVIPIPTAVPRMPVSLNLTELGRQIGIKVLGENLAPCVGACSG